MKVAVSSTGKDLDANIDPRFGRCAYFIIIDPESMDHEAFENQSAMLGGGAGIQASQFVASKGAEVVITGNCGPNAMRTLEAAGIKVITGCSGTVREAIEDFKNGKLSPTSEPTVGEHFGIRSTDAVDNNAEGLLRIAVPIDGNMLSQHFGHAKQFLIADIKDGEIKGTEMKTPPPHEPGVLPNWMSELGVNVVIAGGMGARAVSLFDRMGIKVIVGAPQMDPVEVIKEYLRGTLRTGDNVCSH